MKPDRRLEGDFHPQSQSSDDETDEHHDKHGRPISCIMTGIVQPAAITFAGYHQKSIKDASRAHIVGNG
jgi:hypothetical protein